MKTTQDLLEHTIFGQGEISIFKTNEILIPYNTFIVFLESFRNTSLNIDAVVYSVGKQEGKFLQKTFTGKNPITFSQALVTLLDFIEITGLGQFEPVIVRMDKDNYAFRTKNNPMTLQYLKLGIRKASTKSFVTGIITGFIEAFTSKVLRGMETKCIMQGYGECVIHVSEGDALQEESEVSGLIKEKNFFYHNQLKSQHNAITEKAISQGHLILDNGLVKLWNIAIAFIPVASLLIYEKYITKKLGPEASSLFYFAGKKQAYAGSMIQVKQYGRKNDYKLYLSMFEHHDLIGCGKGKVLAFEEKNGRVRLESDNNTYLRYHNYLFGSFKPVNSYLAGLTGGITSAYFGKEMQSDEVNISKQRCEFELFAQDKRYPEFLERLAATSLTVRGFLK